MGRSGTSLLSQILQAKGVWFGNKAEIIGQTPINVSGQMEHIPIQKIHRELLSDIFNVNTWLFKGKLEKGWHKNELVWPYKDKLKQQLLRFQYSSISPIHGFKDARTTMLLPLWNDIFKETGITPSYVLALRNPKSVYKSLIRAGEVTNNPAKIPALEQDIIDICQQYNENAYKYADISCIIKYEDWFNGNRFLQDFNLSNALNLPTFKGLDLIHEEEKHF